MRCRAFQELAVQKSRANRNDALALLIAVVELAVQKSRANRNRNIEWW